MRASARPPPHLAAQCTMLGQSTNITLQTFCSAVPRRACLPSSFLLIDSTRLFASALCEWSVRSVTHSNDDTDGRQTARADAQHIVQWTAPIAAAGQRRAGEAGARTHRRAAWQ